MAKLTRHVGRYSNSGSRVVVVFRKLEDDSGQCLIVETDSLPDMVQDNVMTIVNSTAGQKEVDLFNALNKSNLSDGSNALTALHQRQLLKKVDISLIEMMPMTNRPVPLSDINAAIDGTAVEPTSKTEAPATADTATLDTGDVDKNAGIAAGLIAQAELLEGDAKAKREQAAKLLPKAKKKVGDGRGKTDAEKAATLEARNERRRVAYEAKKQTKIDAKIDAQVAKKVVRDADFVPSDN